MTTHLSPEQIRQYRERVLTVAELLAASSHVSTCEACRAQLVSPDAARTTAAAFRSVLETAADEGLPAVEHLAYEDIEAHVDGRLDAADAARVAAHLRECSACTDDVGELEAFSRTLKTPLERSGLATRIASTWRSWQPWNFRVLVPAAALGGLLLVVMLRNPSPIEEHTTAPPLTATSQAPPTIRDGSQGITIAQSGAITGLEALPKPYRDMVERALVEKRLDVPAALSELGGRGGVLLGAPGATASVGALRPLGTVVESDRPVFTWSGPEGAAYLVSVYDEQFNEAGKSEWIRAAEWTMPRALRRGARYSWQLAVRLKGAETIVPAPPLPEARFRVLGAEELKELTAVRAANGGSHLVLAVMYARLGLLDAAERELRTLTELNPESPIVSQLSASLQQRRGL